MKLVNYFVSREGCSRTKSWEAAYIGYVEGVV